MEIDGKFRPIDTTKTVDVLKWCREYCTYGPYAQAPHIRYYIGFYQISQGIEWRGTDSEYESWASAMIHMVGAVEMLKADGLEEFLPADLLDIPRLPVTSDTWSRMLLLHTARGMKHIHYGVTTSKKVKRRSRYRPRLLAENVAHSVKILMGLTSKEKRSEAIWNASSIITGAI